MCPSRGVADGGRCAAQDFRVMDFAAAPLRDEDGRLAAYAYSYEMKDDDGESSDYQI